MMDLARAARSAEKLFETLRREFPPTLQSIRLTGMEISDLTDDVSEGVQSAGNVVKQVDQSLSQVRSQAQKVKAGTRSAVVGLKAAWKTLTGPQKPTPPRRSPDRLPPTRSEFELPANYPEQLEQRPSSNHSVADLPVQPPIAAQPTDSAPSPETNGVSPRPLADEVHEFPTAVSSPRSPGTLSAVSLPSSTNEVPLTKRGDQSTSAAPAPPEEAWPDY